MAYGRLDIYWPDGQIETHLLTQATISIGRSSSSTIPLDTDTVSRYHFSLSYDGNRIFITDLESVNGTYLDGVRLQANQPTELNGGEEIQVGQIRMTFHAVDDSPTLPLSPVPEDTQRIEREAVNCRVDVQFPHVTVTPGAYASVELIVTNIGESSTIFELEVVGLPHEWARINRPSLELLPKEEALVLMNIKPTRRPTSQPGDYSVSVRVRQHDRPDLTLEVPLRVTIQGYSGFGAALRSSHVKMGEPLTLHVHNQGSLPLELTFSARGTTRPARFQLSQTHTLLAPDQRAQVAITAQPTRARTFGAEQAFPVDVIVKAAQLPHFTVALPSTFSERPPLPLWSAVAFGALGLVALLLITVGTLNLLNVAARPVLEQVTVNNGDLSVERGQPLNVAWIARNAQTIELQLGDSLTVLDGDAAREGFVALNTDALNADNATLTVSAVTGGNRDSQTLQIVVYTPIELQFTVEPQQITRNMRQTLTLTWQVSGAEEVVFLGLEALSADAPPPVTSPAQVSGYATNDFTLTLQVMDRRGQTHERSVTVRVLPMLCVPLAADTHVYGAPSITANIAAVLQPNSPAEASGIDQYTRTWLLFTLPDGVTAWGERAAFACPPGIVVDDLRPIDVPVPTPTIAPPLTLVPPTATASPTPRTAPTTNPTLLTRTPVRTP